MIPYQRKKLGRFKLHDNPAGRPGSCGKALLLGWQGKEI
jgi:hypothetical protein